MAETTDGAVIANSSLLSPFYLRFIIIIIIIIEIFKVA